MGHEFTIEFDLRLPDFIVPSFLAIKVETVGDCYVAATGLPTPREDHAVAMAKFANEALAKMQIITKKLEVELGPDTGDLSYVQMRERCK